MPFPKKFIIPLIIHLLSHLVRSLQIFVVGFLIILGVSTTVIHAESIPEKAPANGIYDPHHHLDDTTIKQIESLNAEYAKTKLRPQIGVVLIDHLDSGLEETANKTARNWKIGYQDTKMGVLTLIAIKDRKIRTEVSSPLGVYLTDQKAYQLNETIKNDFRNQQYSKGLLKYLVELDTQLQPVLTKSEKELKDEAPESNPAMLLVIFGAVIVLTTILIAIAESMGLRFYQDGTIGYRSSSSGSHDNYYNGISNHSSSSHSSHDSHDSSSGWSSSDWSGGGFDGGGSSGGW